MIFCDGALRRACFFFFVCLFHLFELSVRPLLVRHLLTWWRPEGFYCLLTFWPVKENGPQRDWHSACQRYGLHPRQNVQAFQKIKWLSFVRVFSKLNNCRLTMCPGACWRSWRKHTRLLWLSDGSQWLHDPGSCLPRSAAPLAKWPEPAGESQISSISPISSLRGHYSSRVHFTWYCSPKSQYVVHKQCSVIFCLKLCGVLVS